MLAKAPFLLYSVRDGGFMLTLKDKDGREVELSVYGQHDDVQIDEAYYTDTGEDVPDNVVDYLMDTYGDKLFEAFQENQVDRADFYEGER